MKIRNYYTLGVILFALPAFCRAEVVVTEIMYDPVGTDYGHEWIEVYNDGTPSIPLTTYKIFEGDAKHAIVGTSDKLLEPNQYAVIAQNASDFRSDYPDFAGELFHSAISLDNAGATIQIVDASSSVAASATYDSSSGGTGDGNSLQRTLDSDVFVARTPSPGAAISSTAIAAKTKPAASKRSPKEISSTTTNDREAASTSHDSRSEAATSGETATISAAASGGGFWWWIAAAALAVASAAALFFAKRYKKREWDIVEES